MSGPNVNPRRTPLGLCPGIEAAAMCVQSAKPLNPRPCWVAGGGYSGSL